MEKLGKKYKAREEEVSKEEIAEASGQRTVQDYIDQYKNVLVGVLIGLVVLVVAIFGWNFYQSQQNVEAGEAMFQAVYDFENENYPVALEGNDSLGTYGFLDIIDSYGSTDAGNLATYYAGIIYLKQGNRADGIAMLEDFSKGTSQLSASAWMALGFAYEDEGDFAKAASAFEDAADAAGNNEQTSPMMLMHAARNYESLGKDSKALSLYKSIKEDYPESTEASNVDKYIGRLE